MPDCPRLTATVTRPAFEAAFPLASGPSTTPPLNTASWAACNVAAGSMAFESESAAVEAGCGWTVGMLEGLLGSMGGVAWPAPTQIVDTAVNGSGLALGRFVAAISLASALAAALSTAVFAGGVTLLAGAAALTLTVGGLTGTGVGLLGGGVG